MLLLRIIFTLSLLNVALSEASSLFSSSSKLIARQQQEPGTPLFLDEPSCDSYQCAVTFKPGDNATAHWLNAPAGNVVLVMTSRTANITDQNVATVPGTTNNCDTEGSGGTCGQFSWIVPSAWIGGNFTLQATSQNDPSIQSYTDTILVVANPDNSINVPFRALDPTADGSSNTATIPPVSSTTTSQATSSTASTNSSIARTSSTNGPASTSTNKSNDAGSAMRASSLSLIVFAISFALLATQL